MDDVRARLEADVRRLTAYPDRVVGSVGHRAARAWAVERFHGLGLAPYLDQGFEVPYEWRGDRFVNVVARIPAARDEAGDGDPTADQEAGAELPVILGAHYDTVPGTPGADDNAASLAIVAEVAARLAIRPAARSVIVVAFDAEEPPYFHQPNMGSIRFVEDHVRDHVHAAIVLDLVAHGVPLPGLADLVAFMGAESHPAWAGILRTVADRYRYVLTVPNEVMPDMSDHRAFRLRELPYLFVTCGQGPHYHRPSDVLDNVDLTKAAAVAEMVEAIVRGAARADMQGAQPHDSSELDFELLCRLLPAETRDRFGLHSARDAKAGLTRLVWLLQEARS